MLTRVLRRRWRRCRRCRRGWRGRITPSVISMALLTNRIGVNKLELFLRDVERCSIAVLC